MSKFSIFITFTSLKWSYSKFFVPWISISCEKSANYLWHENYLVPNCNHIRISCDDQNESEYHVEFDPQTTLWRLIRILAARSARKWNRYNGNFRQYFLDSCTVTSSNKISTQHHSHRTSDRWPNTDCNFFAAIWLDNDLSSHRKTQRLFLQISADHSKSSFSSCLNRWEISFNRYNSGINLISHMYIINFSTYNKHLYDVTHLARTIHCRLSSVSSQKILYSHKNENLNFSCHHTVNFV